MTADPRAVLDSFERWASTPHRQTWPGGGATRARPSDRHTPPPTRRVADVGPFPGGVSCQAVKRGPRSPRGLLRPGADAYALPRAHDGPVGDVLRVAHRHPYRPAHIHFIVSAARINARLLAFGRREVARSADAGVRVPWLAPSGDAYPRPVRFQWCGPASLVSCSLSVFSSLTTASVLRPAEIVSSWPSVCAFLTRFPSPFRNRPLGMSALSEFTA
jgi:hypothetical protein